MMPQLSSMIMNSSTFVMLIMIVLLVFSLISWAFFFERLFFIKKISKEISEMTTNALNSASFDDFLRGVKYNEFKIINFFSSMLEGTNVSEMLEKKELVEKKIENGINDTIENIYGVLEYLSMIVTISPFLGLLGTVWGIMTSFMEIGVTGEASLAVVAPGIAEALVTTIAGLVVAIPASIFYAYFNRKAKAKEAQIVNIYNLITGIIEYDSKKR